MSVPVALSICAIAAAAAGCERDRPGETSAPAEPTASRPVTGEDLSRMPDPLPEAVTPQRPCPDATTRFDNTRDGIREVGCVDSNKRRQGPATRTVANDPSFRLSVSYSDDVYHGRMLLRLHHPDGHMFGAVRNYAHGELVEDHQYLDGVRTDTKRYKGEKVVEHITWYPDGQRSARMSVRDGDLHGPSTTWHPNGTKASEGEWRNGDKIDHWSYWDANGQPSREP
jgi:hypothetical protein